MAKKKALHDLSPAELKTVIEKQFGKGTMIMGDDESLEITRIPCGIMTIDIALGGGFARGRHTEIYGGYSVGKTYVTYRLIANAQRKGLKAAFVDVESSFDPRFAESAGVDLAELAYHRQEHGNKVIDFMEMLLYSRQYDVIVMDSIAALLPVAERDSDMSKASMGMEQAKLMSKAMRKLTTANRDTALVYINQTRDAVGSMFKANVTSGGRAMEFYAGTRLEFVRTENIKRTMPYVNPKTQEEGKRPEVVGHRVLVKVEKDKTGGARRHSQTSFLFNYLNGQADPVEDLIYLGRIYGLVHKQGTKSYWVEGWEKDKKSGKANFKRWLRNSPHITEELEELIWEAWEDEQTVELETDDDSEDE